MSTQLSSQFHSLGLQHTTITFCLPKANLKDYVSAVCCHQVHLYNDKEGKFTDHLLQCNRHWILNFVFYSIVFQDINQCNFHPHKDETDTKLTCLHDEHQYLQHWVIIPWDPHASSSYHRQLS